jgi:hypothetical protein
MSWLPPPASFTDGQRALALYMLFGAGIVCTLIAVGALLIVWIGGWNPGTEAQRLSIIGWALLGALVGMGAVIVSLAIGGPVGRFRGGVGKDGVTFEAEGDAEK